KPLMLPSGKMRHRLALFRQILSILHELIVTQRLRIFRTIYRELLNGSPIAFDLLLDPMDSHGSKAFGRSDPLSQGVERLKLSLGLEVPVGPAVASGQTLDQRTDLVDRAGDRVDGEQAVGPNLGLDAAPGVVEALSGHEDARFH